MRMTSIKHVLLILLLILIPATASAVQPYKVVVFGFTTDNSSAVTTVETMSELYRYFLQESGRLTLVSPEPIAIDSQSTAMPDLKKPTTREEALVIGRQMGVDRIITGKAVQLGSAFTVYSTMSDVPTGNITAAVKVEGADEMRPDLSMLELSRLLTGKLRYLGHVMPADSTDPVDLVRIDLGASTGFNHNEKVIVERRIGYNWIELGRMSVVESFPDYSLCQVTSMVDVIEIEPGDRTRRVKPEDGEPAGIALTVKKIKPRRTEPLFTFKKDYASILVPGTGQVWSNKGRNRGVAYTVLFLGAAYLWYDNSSKLYDANDTYDLARQNYSRAITTSAISSYYNEQKNAYDDMKKYRTNRQLFFGLTAGVWAVSVIDMFFWDDLHKMLFSKGYRLPVRLKATPDRIGISINFNLGK